MRGYTYAKRSSNTRNSRGCPRSRRCCETWARATSATREPKITNKGAIHYDGRSGCSRSQVSQNQRDLGHPARISTSSAVIHSDPMYFALDFCEGISHPADAQAIPSDEGTVAPTKDFVTIRLDQELKAELQKAAELESRSLSNFGRLLLEHAWAEYLKAGSMRELISHRERTLDRSR